MNFEKLKQQLKEDMRRRYSFGYIVKKEYIWPIFAIFLINIIGIFCMAVMGKDFPLQIFLGIFAVSGLVLVSVIWKIFTANLKKNLPDLFERERIKYGTLENNFNCYLLFIGNMCLRGFGCKIYVYKKALLVKFGRYCLVIDDTKYIRLDKALIGCRCEFEKGDKYVQCRLNNEQLEIIKKWQKDITEQNKYWNG